jgi:glycosyltransferase involved in cell wall biosynthesis
MTTTRPLRIAMVAARALPLMGGIETHVHEVSRRLAARGDDVTVLTTDAAGDLPAADQQDGYRVQRFAAWPRGRDYYFSPGLARHLARGGYDVVHVQGVHTLVPPMALAAAKRAGIPSLLTFHTGGHSSPGRSALRDLQWRVLSPFLRMAATLVAVCEFEQHRFAGVLGRDPSSIRLVRNGSEPLPVAAASNGSTAGAPLVISVGRLERYKGHHRVLRALPPLIEKAPGARLVLVGSGPYEPQLRAQAAELGVTDRVSITSFGPQDRPAMGRLVADADVMCLLSDYEAHPVAVLEALGTGTRALVADTSGLSELGRDGLVSTVPLEAAPDVVADAALAVAAAPSAPPPSLLSWDGCAQQLSALYREVAR